MLPRPEEEVADGWRLSGDRPPALLAGVALVPLAPLGVLGIVPVAELLAEFLEEPAEIGGELAFIVIEEFLPKQTLSLGRGVVSPMIEPPEVVSSLGTGKKVGFCPESSGLSSEVC